MMPEIYNTAYEQYVKAVDLFTGKPVTSKDRAEHLLDGLLDFCDDVRFIALYKEVCRHLYRYFPESAVYYVNLFRDQYLKEIPENENGNNNI